MLSVTRFLFVPVALMAILASCRNARGEDGKFQLAQAPLAEQPSGTYSPLEAADDSYRYAEGQRREAIARQM